jgi:hypothetical protein
MGIVGDELLAIVSEPDEHQERSHLGLVYEALDGRVAVRVIDPARAPVGESVSYEDIDGRSRTLLGGRVLDPFGVWFMPAIGWVHDGVLERSLVLALGWQQHAVSEHPDRVLDRTLLEVGADPLQLEWARRAVSEHVRILRGRFPGALWVNDPVALDLAEDRPTQLQVARGLGIRYPRTLQTSDPDLARRFVATELGRDGCVMKSATKAVFTAEDGGEMIVPAVSIGSVDEFEYDNLDLGPMILQQRIVGKRDIRVTVVGENPEHVFAAEIIPDTIPGPDQVDYRVSWYRFAYHRLPEPVTRDCIALVRGLGLQHGEIDLMLTPDGEYVLGEVNSNGNWGGVQLQTHQPIADAFVEHLLVARPPH